MLEFALKRKGFVTRVANVRGRGLERDHVARGQPMPYAV